MSNQPQKQFHTQAHPDGWAVPITGTQLQLEGDGFCASPYTVHSREPQY